MLLPHQLQPLSFITLQLVGALVGMRPRPQGCSKAKHGCGRPVKVLCRNIWPHTALVQSEGIHVPVLPQQHSTAQHAQNTWDWEAAAVWSQLTSKSLRSKGSAAGKRTPSHTERSPTAI